MRILCLTARLPYPPDRGDRLRAFHFLERLAREHEITLASFIGAESERENAGALRSICREMHTVLQTRNRSVLGVAANLWRSDPLQVSFYRSVAMSRLVDRLLRETRFDVVYVHLLRMAQYVRGMGLPYRVVDLTDAISEELARSLPFRGRLSRLMYGVELPRVERYERWVVRTFEETWLISRADRHVLAEKCPKANLKVVSNGVEADRFYPTGEAAKPDCLLFVGHLRVPHNVDAVTHLVRDVLPRVREQVPGCTLEIVGAEPGPAVRSLAGEPGVSLVGYVEDLNARLNAASVFVAPLRFAAGVQNKVLEAMAAGRPVVTTTLVNDGLGARPDREILLADDAQAMASQIVRLLQDRELRARIGYAGREFVRRTFSWDGVARRMSEIEALVKNGSARPAEVRVG